MTTKKNFKSILIFLLLALVGCDHNMVIINDVDEREANEIIVFLASRGISSEKMQVTTSGANAGNEAVKWSISVNGAQSTKAMAILNQNGLPRKKGTNLLDLFAKAGLMSSEKEETIRYQAGLAEQIANMIRKIDGVLDADVQVSFPPIETSSMAYGSQEKAKKITAAVYVKHQGILDDPNSHLVSKIKRLVSGSVTGLDLNDVTVISDRARFIDVSLMATANESLEEPSGDYVSIWSIVLNKQSAGRFRAIFFLLILCLFIFILLISWLIWKFYPFLKQKGSWKNLLKIAPFREKEITTETSDNES